MKVLVVNNMAPFVRGGAEELADHLCRNLERAGHQAELLRIPFQWEPAVGIPAQMLLVRALEIRNVDRVIALKFPAYLIRHQNKVLWLLHQYRQAYDLRGTPHSNIPESRQGDEIRAAITAADNQSFAECAAIYTNSEVTRSRLERFNGFDAKVLHPPVNDPENFPGGDDEGYVFAGGRINTLKRQHLLVEAMRHAGPSARLLVAGPADSPADAERLEKLVETYGLRDRVTLDIRLLPRETYARYVNGARAVAYLPYDEDSLGYVSMEAATAGKALLTTPDSGGVSDLARPGETGWKTEPEAEALGAALAEIAASQEESRNRGLAARLLWKSYDVSWESTVRALLA